MTATILLMSSCEHKQLCYDHSHIVCVEVLFDWVEASDANPQSISLYLFPEDGSKPLRYEFTDKRGGTIRVPTGSFDALCFNSDTENLRYRNTGHLTSFELYSRPSEALYSLKGLIKSPSVLSLGEEKTVLEPEIIWSDYLRDLEFSKDSPNSVVLVPKLSTNIYTIEINNVDNLQYITSISASLSGLAVGLYPGQGCDVVSEEAVTIPFEAKVSKRNQRVEAQMQSFGHCSMQDNSHTLTVFAEMSDNSRWYYRYNVTDQIHAASDPRHVRIVLNSLPLPSPMADGGGLVPKIEEWETTIISIKL